MDYLCRLILDLEQKGETKGASTENSFNMLHILFVDDSLIFIEDNDEYLTNLSYILHTFEFASGLNFNLNKSTITSINVDPNSTNHVASE